MLLTISHEDERFYIEANNNDTIICIKRKAGVCEEFDLSFHGETIHNDTLLCETEITAEDNGLDVVMNECAEIYIKLLNYKNLSPKITFDLFKDHYDYHNNPNTILEYKDISFVSKKFHKMAKSIAGHGVPAIHEFKTLLGKQLDLEYVQQNGITLLAKACKNGNIDLVKYYLDSGVGIHSRTNYESDILENIVQSGNEELFILLSGSLDVNPELYWSTTPLVQAIATKKIKMVKALLEAGADPKKHSGYRINGRRYFSASPKEIAWRFGYHDIEKLLSEYTKS